MAVAFDAATTAQVNTTASISWTHPGGGSASAVAVVIYNFSAAATISSATYGGQPFDAPVESVNDGVNKTFLMGLTNLVALGLTGNQTVAITMATAGNFESVSGSLSVTGSDTSTVFSNHTEAHGTGASITATVTSAADEYVFGGGGQDPGGTFTFITGTSVWNATNGGSRGFGIRADGASTVSPAVTTTGLTDTWTIVLGSFKAAAASGQGRLVGGNLTGGLLVGGVLAG